MNSESFITCTECSLIPLLGLKYSDENKDLSNIMIYIHFVFLNIIRIRKL